MNAYEDYNRKIFDDLVLQFQCSAMRLTLQRFAKKLEFDNRDAFCAVIQLIQFLLENESST